MAKIVPVVEGDGEERAVPILLRKLLYEAEVWDVEIARPRTANGRGNLLKPGGLERFLQVAWNEPDCGAVLVLLDADDECAQALAQDLAGRTLALGPRHSVVIACAKCEYEAWFLASLQTIVPGSKLPFPEDLTFEGDVESIRGVKGWLSHRLPKDRAYLETRDQPAMTELLDPARARERSRSFRRLCSALSQAVQAIRGGTVVVTPQNPVPAAPRGRSTRRKPRQ